MWFLLLEGSFSSKRIISRRNFSQFGVSRMPIFQVLGEAVNDFWIGIGNLNDQWLLEWRIQRAWREYIVVDLMGLNFRGVYSVFWWNRWYMTSYPQQRRIWCWWWDWGWFGRVKYWGLVYSVYCVLSLYSVYDPKIYIVNKGPVLCIIIILVSITLITSPYSTNHYVDVLLCVNSYIFN